MFRLVAAGVLALPANTAVAGAAAQSQPPNLIVISCDDLGYGDLGSFGHPTISTPELDRMASEGQRWTSFYAGASACTPSRAALITGRLPVRSGLYGDANRNLTPDSERGLPQSEWTLAEALSGVGYATACIGKWHLGHRPPHLPQRHGFDTFFGTPYSNDMDPAPGVSLATAYANPRFEDWTTPLMRDDVVIERPLKQNTITRRYTDEAVRFIEANSDRPFFLYLAHNMPHVPLFASPQFAGTSERGRYGDAVEEIDAGVGEILDALRELHIDGRTLVVFTSDNGPWLGFAQDGGSAGLLKGGKNGTAEGGFRVPAIFWWPGTITPRVVKDLGSTMDLLPSFTGMLGLLPPAGTELDGVNLSGVWLGQGPSPRRTVFYYRGSRLFAVRHESFKAHFLTQSDSGVEPAVAHDPPLLFHVGHDPSEAYEIGAQHPAVIATIRAIRQQHLAQVTAAPSLID